MDRPFINTTWGLDCHNSDQTILAWVNFNDFSEGPLGGNKAILLEDDYVSNRGVSRGVMPLCELPETGEVVRWPSHHITARSGGPDFGISASDGGGRQNDKKRQGVGDLNGFPMRKCPGVKTSIPSSSQDKWTSGLLLRQASICVKTVVNLLKVSLTLATICFMWVFLLLTAASQRPPKTHTFRDELPLYMLGRTEFRNGSLSLLVLQNINKFLQLLIFRYEICAMII